MGFVFVSHASIDKLRHVRPIVLALAREHVGIWVDKPGQGDRHLGLDQAVIERLGIRGLMNGPDWNLQISEALQECDAVLVCLSKQLLNDSAVLNQEVAIGWHSRKLVACRVDDLDLEDIPTPSDCRIFGVCSRYASIL